MGSRLDFGRAQSDPLRSPGILAHNERIHLMSTFAHMDTTRADGAYVSFERVVEVDRDTSPSDFERGVFDPDQEFWGVTARAHIIIVRNGVGTIYLVTSPGVGGVDDPWGAYGDELYAEEVKTLREDLAMFGTLTQDPEL